MIGIIQFGESLSIERPYNNIVNDNLTKQQEIQDSSMQKESSSSAAAAQKTNYSDNDSDFLNQVNNFVAYQDDDSPSVQPTPIGVGNTINVVDQLSLNEVQSYSFSAARDLHDWAELIRESSNSKDEKNSKPDPSNSTKKSSNMMTMMTSTNDDEQDWFSSIRGLQGPSSISDLVATSEGVDADLTRSQGGVASLPKQVKEGEKGREEEEDSDNDEDFSSKAESLQIHEHQNEKWNERYQQLVDFHRTHGHSVVPYHYKECPPLAWWVKR